MTPEPRLAPRITDALDAIKEVLRVFGAPGDHGYDTPEGKALFALSQCRVGLHQVGRQGGGEA